MPAQRVRTDGVKELLDGTIPGCVRCRDAVPEPTPGGFSAGKAALSEDSPKWRSSSIRATPDSPVVGHMQERIMAIRPRKKREHATKREA
jgi:hypothetical protein